MRIKVKTKFKKHLLKFFQIVFLGIVCLTLTACAGFDPDLDIDPDEIEDLTGGISVEGVKVLRRPLDGYNFDENVPENDGTTDFYYSFASDIISYLFYTYGNFNSSIDAGNNLLLFLYNKTGNEQVGELANQFETDPDEFLYFYDAIRYQITDAQGVNDPNADTVTVTADTSRGWNWSLTANVTYYSSLIYGLNSSLQENGMLVSNTFTKEQFTYSFYNEYYTGGQPFGTDYFDQDIFQSAYVNEDYINGLTYAIYSLVLGLEPNAMTVSYSSGSPVLTIEGYTATAQDTSAELALKDVKITFNELGSYVGLTERNKLAITNFVLDEIIGENAQQLTGLYDLYYDDVVSAIVDYCGSLTRIGQANEETGEGETTVGDSFMASEVVDYPYTSFFSSFEEDPFQYTKGPYEYQSFVIMPSKEVEITDIWLDFKYDAGKDGDLIYDESKFLDINVSVRWNKGDGSPVKVLTKSIRIYDGKYSFGAEGSFLEFELDLSEMEGGFGEVVKVGQFNCPKALIPNPLTQGRVIPINGFTDARRYYKVIESESYGGYGVLDESRIEGSYLEVAFDVVKQPGDTTTNYAFYTAISGLFETVEWPGEPEWH